ncbi:MAG: D-hexose-6-phosphate mutarotase [Spirochaetes bacterium]|nr:D-hexose-6-phosphate mutarotase [Spirochaetota bacterium]
MPLNPYSAFTMPPFVQIQEGGGGFPCFKITNDYTEAEMYLYGAHVTKFHPRHKKPLLWMSPTSSFMVGKPIRGGIPLCFPWFGPHKQRKDYPIHGFMRIRSFEPVSVAQLSDGRTRIQLMQKSDETSITYWPHEYMAEVTATFGESLEVSLTVTNPGDEPFSFEDCMHTYFAVTDAPSAVVSDLNGVCYMDRLANDSFGVQYGELLVGNGLTKIFTRVPRMIRIQDRASGRVIRTEQYGMANTVVWNPGKETAAENPEIAGREREFLCIEAANCVNTPIILLPGCSHTSTVRYSWEST